LSVRGEQRSLIAGPAGQLEIAINVAETARSIALITHPHPLQGGTLDNKVVQTLGKTFTAIGYVAVRFNFRGAGRSDGSFDDGIGETDDALAVLDFARRQYPGIAARPPVLAGFSFGAYVQTRVARTIQPERIVVIHGEEDDVVPLADVFAWARPQQLPIIVFPGCGHFFHGRLPQLQRVVTGMWQR